MKYIKQARREIKGNSFTKPSLQGYHIWSLVIYNQRWVLTSHPPLFPFTFLTWPEVWRLFPAVLLPDVGDPHSTKHTKKDKTADWTPPKKAKLLNLCWYPYLKYTCCLLIQVHSFLQVYRLYQSEEEKCVLGNTLFQSEYFLLELKVSFWE